MSEQRLIDANTMWNCDTCFHYNNDKCSKNIWCDAGESYRPAFDKLKKIDAIPVVHGHWLDFSDKYDKGLDLRCSVCKEQASKFVGGSEDWWDSWKPNYCPHCGARMDETEK